MKLSKTLKIDAVEYASQGNAILGIRDSGKTYSATYLAEQLHENHIPFVAFDPIGVWRYLKVGKKGAGLSVVVAGENGDLPLTPESAPDIVRAAMRENVSLIIDLYSMQLSKSDWKKIVESCIRLLLYENKQYGLRHIFIEEAAEFVAQVVRPEDGKVYAEIEKLARMGGNASLGYTLINQRAEQVNKSVLELCDCLFLHRQKGRHSLTALGKWLDVADASNSKEIINSLPSLAQGECWVWMQGSHNPVRIKMPEKKTVHPNRRNPKNTVRGVMSDVSVFVYNMQSFLSEEYKKHAENKKSSEYWKELQPQTVKPKSITMKIDKNAAEIEDLKKQITTEKKLRVDAERRLAAVKKMLQPQYNELKKIFAAAGDPSDNDVIDIGPYQKWLDKFDGKHRIMFEQILEHKKLDRAKWCLLSGIPYTSNWFDKGFSKMKTFGLVAKEGGNFVLKQV